METPVLLRRDSNELIRDTFEYRRVSFKQIAQTHLCLDVSVFLFFCCSQVQQLASTGLWQNMHQNRNTGSSSCIVHHHIIGRTCISIDTHHHHHTQYKNSTCSSSSCTRSNIIHTQEQNLVSYPAGPRFIFHSTIDTFLFKN